ncbi:MAG: helix-turn-helix transcriptional regulator [Planctomycetes bacterium]|nr:helix-turn-helix transcriptional regulator [Planctomycetota bacterium]
MPDDLLHRFGERVRQLRKRKKLSQERLALEAGLDRSYMGSVERGEYNVTLTTVQKISKALRVSLHELFRL